MNSARTLRLGFLLAALSAICLAQGPAQHKIGVRTVNGVGQFYLRDTGAPFVPRGNNFIRLAQQTRLPAYGATPQLTHSLFNVGLYSASDAEQALARMQSDGYNTVRVFLNNCCSAGVGNIAGGLSAAYLTNVADFLARAKAHGIYVVIVDWALPEGGGYDGIASSDTLGFGFPNQLYMSGGGIRASSKFWADLVSGLAAANAPFDAILGFDIQNELHYDIGQAPLSAISGIVTTANGKSYNVSDPVARQAMMDDNLVNFINQVRSAIVQVDPTALVTVSFFPPKGPNSTKAFEDPIHQVIRTYPAICCSTADFIDLHAYLWGLTLPQLVQNYESAGLKTKPLVMFEYGALLSDQVSLEDAAGSLQKWQSDSCANGFSGWALWNWDVAFTVDSSYRPAIAGSDAVNNAMKPSTRPDPCTSGSFAGQNLAGSTTALASKEIAGSLAVNAIDGNPKTVWSAGAFAPQWLELKLPRPAIVSSIRLTTSQSPDGATDHKLYTRGHDGQLQLVSEFAALTKDNQVLTWTPQTPMAGVEAVRIETVTSPSWIAWREVDILSADPSLPAITFIGNGAVFDAAVTPGSWVSILGSGLAASSRAWDAADFSGSILPKKLDGVAVTFNGAPASLYYVSPSQINLQAPAMPTGQPVTVTVTRAAVQATASANVVSTANDPGLFSYFVSGVRYSAAVFTDGTILGDPSALPGTRSAKAGDHLAFYGTGFASSASGVLFDLPVALPDPVTCTIGGQKATVEYAGLVSPGLFQINVVMPNLAAGNYPVVIGYHGAITSLPPVVPVR